MKEQRMNSESRTERIAASLEQRFEDCSALAHDCVVAGERYTETTDWHLRATALFLRTSAQIAGVIARLEAQSARERENRGSIPQ
jgi:hypothetical protein